MRCAYKIIRTLAKICLKTKSLLSGSLDNKKLIIFLLRSKSVIFLSANSFFQTKSLSGLNSKYSGNHEYVTNEALDPKIKY